MTLNLALNNAISGLQINQRSLGVLSQNIANANTPGYSRQILSQSAVVVEGVGNGVRADGINRKIDTYLQRSVLAQSSTTNASKTITGYYNRLQTIIGQPGASNSIDQYTTSFFNALETLANNPDVGSIRSNAVSAATNLATQLSGLAAGIEDLRFQADNDIQEAVRTINVTLKSLDDININIARASNLGQSVTGLEDRRDAALRTLSENLNISVTYNANRTVSVVAGDGTSLVEDGVTHQLSYNPAQSVETLISSGSLNALSVLTINDRGAQVSSQPLFTAGASANVTTNLSSGTLVGLQQVRDELLPDILAQIDQLASRVRDDVNAIHNKGSGFPPATVLTGDRPLRASDQFEFAGSVRIAVLNPNGTPVQSSYLDELTTGIRPLLLNLSQLDSGQGRGKPTIQTIVDEINNHFTAPGNKAKLGNLNNIRLASSTATVPNTPPLFSFDLDLENISANSARVFVTGTTVRDNLGANITNVTQTPPALALATTGTYTTTAGTGDVTITAQSLSGVAVGDVIYLNAPSVGSVNGITPAQLTGYFTVQSVSGNQFTITTTGTAGGGAPVSDPSAVTLFPPYATVAAGQQTRTTEQGALQVDLSGNLNALYYDVTLDVGVVDATTGAISTSQITYRVPNDQTNFLNKRVDATSANGAGSIVLPQTSQESLRAILVDANGNELPRTNGVYSDEPAFLKIIGGNAGATYSIAIDELDSRQLGTPNGAPPQAGTNRGFSHFFGLNNLFKSNGSTLTGDVLKNSAINLEVVDRIRANNNLISTGTLVRQNQPADASQPRQYTYLRFSGDNVVAQQLARLSSDITSFDAAGGLSASQVSLQTYTNDILGLTSSRTAGAREISANAESLLAGFSDRANAVSGVNLDEELANTIILQNSYAASARIVTVVNELYDTLINII